MQRMLIVNKEQADLLLDSINIKIVQLLINEELNSTQISEKTKIPISTVWRRLKKLENSGLIEIVKTERRRNFKTVFYRAKALYYALPFSPDLVPKDPEVKEIYQRILELREKSMRKTKIYNEIPSNVDPIDYAIVLDVLSNFEVVLENESEIKDLLEKARNFLFSSLKVNVK
ncbi:winged helix-turn-helix domain-containing protein [Acidianus sp. HS-5]|uniref:winged helix-turn-helix domain-containing protein n=1 Tax=Acidianus sp. HS-5 TaxID=2886040 RepID=UPI001F224D5A|nr:winged helix-turn-helix domain-containing protein [Acidianus sp. HS-5]BDC19488.1 hypothetical protein HS5_23780 [Acidianus sp. HS-5]